MGGILILVASQLESVQNKRINQGEDNLLYGEGMHPPASRIPRAQIRMYLDIYWLDNTKLHR